MKDVFIQKEVTYGFRDVNILVQPKYKTVTYGHNTILLNIREANYGIIYLMI